MFLNKLHKALVGLYYTITCPGSFKELLLSNYQQFYANKQNKLTPVNIYDIVPPDTRIVMKNMVTRDGNVAPFELMCISLLCSYFKPKRIFEIGTFDGNTTLQLALNSPGDSEIYTMDLPYDMEQGKFNLQAADLKYVIERKKLGLKYQESGGFDNIKQIFADSAQYDFSRLAGVDFVFIDGCHSYDYVKNDTEKVFKILNQPGIVLWHDYSFHWPGVWKYLHEISRCLPVVNLKGTSLALYIKNRSG